MFGVVLQLCKGRLQYSGAYAGNKVAQGAAVHDPIGLPQVPV